MGQVKLQLQVIGEEEEEVEEEGEGEGEELILLTMSQVILDNRPSKWNYVIFILILPLLLNICI
jgi:hypothetical protein